MPESEVKIHIHLTDMPPSANGLRKTFIAGNKVKSVKTKSYAAWRSAAIWEIATQKAGKLVGPYRLEISAQRNWRTKRPRDIDNIIKPISDALVKAGVVTDDSLAESVFAEWRDDVEGVRIVVRDAAE